ncbi:PAS sensor protein [Burkholderia diffusa]|uniref:PAS domain S-box protein n=1 Tax=Burkholderia diffusa TaxID=488732 RepID=UPI001CB6120C|nr:PAS domain S-box protein [Burkholderia diffusa]CAG9260853.1 PAS sensor protein [Burkholderia diffusa]
MKHKKLTLDDELGTATPAWKLASHDDVLKLFSESGEHIRSITLRAGQASKIRALSVEASIVFLDVNLCGRTIKLHLVGKRVSTYEWAGLAAALCDSKAVAHNVSQVIAFSEQIVSDVNSIVVVITRSGRIRRFNKMAEERTGCLQQDVVGMSAQDLFMPQDDALASLNNIDRFFETGRVADVERTIMTLSGPRRYMFRNRFTPSTGEKLLVCSGIDVTDVKGDESRASSSFDDANIIEAMRKISNFASLVAGARALLECYESGARDLTAITQAREIADRAIQDAYSLHEEFDVMMLGGGRAGNCYRNLS